MRASHRRGIAGLAVVVAVSWYGLGDDVDRRLAAMRTEIVRLRGDLAVLEAQERGVLGDIERLGAEARLRRAELREVNARLGELETEIGSRQVAIETLESDQDDRRRYLAFRLREMYKQGPGREMRLALGGDDVEGYLGGLRYAAFLSNRDQRVLHEFRGTRETLGDERASLVTERTRLLAVRAESVAAKRALERAQERRSRVLSRLRQDREVRRVALVELETASSQLHGLVERLASGDEVVGLDIRRFRGVLDPPLGGAVEAPFGEIVHPRFRTVVPHPGLDLEAPEGAPFASVFDGRVIYASWLRGYGLTAIVDHGGEILSIYAHASVLTVEEGDRVLRGQTLGRVGETGSLKGPYLYFELRDAGKPVDPQPWFRRN